MEDNNSSISETQLDVHAEKDCTCIKDNTNNSEEHDLTLDKGILHSIDKGNGGMPSASSQGTIDEGLGDSFVKDDLSNSEKADGRRKRRKHRVACYRGKRTKSANTRKKTEIDECAMMLKPPGSSLPMKSASEIVQKSSPVSCILTMTPETVQKEVEEFISPDSGIATLCPWSNSLEVTPSSGFESCTEYGKTPSATKRGNATEVEETDLKNIIDEQTEVDLVRKLQRNYIKIKSEIDPLYGLADELFQAEIIGEQDYDKIRSARDMTKRSADLLLKAVAYNITPLKLKKFIYFLRKCKYDYIADLLQNNSIQNLNRSCVFPLDLSQVNNFKNLQRKFGKLKKLLLKDFDPKYVIDELLEMEVISFIDHEDIWTTQFNEQRIDCVLKCVKRNIEINLGPFSSILRNHSEWLAEEIDLLSNDPESSDDSDANAVTVLELSCKEGNWTGRIEGPFKSIPDINIRIEFKTEKTQNVDDDVVRRQGDSTNLSLDMTLSKVHCKCDRVDKGSIIVRLQPLSTRALQKLKDSKPEDVMAIVKCLLTNEDLKILEAAKLTSVEIKIEALDSTLPNPISLKEEGITKEAIVEHFTYLSTCVPNIKEFIPAFLQDVQISDESKAFLKEILSMKREDRNEAFLRFLLQEETGRPRIIFKRQLRKMKEISLLQKLGNRNEIVLKDELGKDEIQMNYSYLLDELDGREFVKIFSEKGFFQEEICDKILRSRNRQERTKVFIDFVLESKKDARDLFFQELEYKHQMIYYVLISTKQASKPSAESLSTLVAMKAAICERYDEVIGETEPKAYRDAFVERKIFTDQEFQELVKICPKENRAAAFLKKLLNGNNVFALKTFLWVLKRTGNESLANGLEYDFYMFDGEEVNSPDIDGTNKCTLMTAVLEAQIIVGTPDESQTEDGTTASPYTSTPLKQSAPSSFLKPKLTLTKHEANRMPSKVPTAVITSEMENNGSTSTVSIMYTSTMQPPTFINTTMANNDTSSSPMEAITTTGCTIIAKTPAHETQTSAITTTSSVNSNTTTGLTVRFDRTKSIIYSPESVLGRGCYGTIVFKGRFDERDVAVKRCLKEIFYFADREMELLRQSDQHPNVIRYYWNEEDDHFLYIAMELCEGTLQDYVENKLVNIKQLKPIELLHQTMKGLAHLHSLDIVHRDIKPHNILISRPGADGEVRALISDFGFARKLPPGTRFFSSYSDFHGTLGWAAPEISIKSRNTTLAVDIFSAGCVMYYVLTRGKYPFGDRTTDKGKFKLNQLHTTSDGYIAKDIIQDMLSSVPEARPTAKAVLQHLLFWNMDDKLRFIEATSDWIETKMVPGIENPKEIFYLDWTEPLSQILKDEVKTDKRYKTTTVQDLLRFIRNKRHHYNDLPADVQKSLGSIPDQYLDYFTSRFPSLLVHTYRVMKCCSKEDAFKAYYKHA